MVMLLLLLNTIDSFHCTKFQIVLFSKVFNTFCERGMLPSTHVSSE
jgi:hypothetical protein